MKRKGNKIQIPLLKKVYRRSAVKRGIVYKLTDIQFEKLIFSKCFYCGIAPFNTFNAYMKKDGAPSSTFHQKNKHKKKNFEYLKTTTILYNGIDRKDNTKGYTKSNCVSCCKDCNQAKMVTSYKVFMKWINRLVKFRS